MSIQLSTPDVEGLITAMRVMRDWQVDGLPVQLHVGDLGWAWQFGAEKTAAAVRTWSRGSRLLALGMLDSPTVCRLAIAPDAADDDELSHQMLLDLTRPERGVLPDGEVAIEARFGELLPTMLRAHGWEPGEAWTPLRRDLTEAVEPCGLRIELVGADRAPIRNAVQRAAFDSSTFDDERWTTMAAGPAYADARCLVGFDDRDDAVAVATVWSAGVGRSGLLEPVGVHRDHRRHGYGTAISLAAAAVLRELGSASAIVCTPSSNTAAVAAYTSAGMEQLPDVRDLQRSATTS